MNKKANFIRLFSSLIPLAVLLFFASGPIAAQTPVPVDDAGNPLTPINATTDEIIGPDEPAPLYTADQLVELVGPFALYPDNLLAIILPASTYPLEIVLAARFLEQLESDNSLQPDETWDESVTALLNYPEVVQMMNQDIELTWQLGEAVLSQQEEVLTAIEAFRNLAYAAGNLQSDENQNVVTSDGSIEITPVDEKIVYVPYYVVEEVIVEQPVPVYHYYPTPRPVYYYPYPTGYYFSSGFFWGVTTAFTIGWHDHFLHVYHPSYYRHPYYGRSYYNDYHYRRHSIFDFNRYYVNNSYRRSRDRHRDGSYWRPQRHSSSRPNDSRYLNNYYTGGNARNRLSEGRRNRGSYGDYRGRTQREGRAAVANNNQFSNLAGGRNRRRDGAQGSGRNNRPVGNALTNSSNGNSNPIAANRGRTSPGGNADRSNLSSGNRDRTRTGRNSGRTNSGTVNRDRTAPGRNAERSNTELNQPGASVSNQSLNAPGTNNVQTAPGRRGSPGNVPNRNRSSDSVSLRNNGGSSNTERERSNQRGASDSRTLRNTLQQSRRSEAVRSRRQQTPSTQIRARTPEPNRSLSTGNRNQSATPAERRSSGVSQVRRQQRPQTQVQSRRPESNRSSATANRSQRSAPVQRRREASPSRSQQRSAPPSRARNTSRPSRVTQSAAPRRSQSTSGQRNQRSRNSNRREP